MKKFMQRAYEAEAQLAALKNVAQQAPAQPARPAAEPQGLTREQFPDEAQYVAAVAQQAVEQIKAATREQVAAVQSANQTQVFAKQADEVRKEIENYDEVINASAVVFSPAIQGVILSSEYSARLAYEIVKDDDFAERFAAMSPTEAARAVGRLEAKIEAEKHKPVAAVTKPVSKAPAPIKPVSSRATEVTPDPSKMTTADWLAQRRKQKYGI